MHLLITDLQMPEMNGLQLKAEVNRLHPATMVIILTGYGTIEKAVEAVRQGAFDFLTKPVASEQLYRTVGKAIDFIRLERESRVLFHFFPARQLPWERTGFTSWQEGSGFHMGPWSGTNRSCSP